MLVIRRRPGESILIETPAGRVEIDVYELSASRVKLGIRAPADILILRKEVLLAQEQNRAAAQAVSPCSIQSLLGQLRLKS
jgi:carbon storage regulator